MSARQMMRLRSFGRIVTSVKVVDASALAALIFSEPEADAIAGRLEGARLAAPSLLDYELANVCLVKIRRAPDQAKTLRAAYGMAHRLRVEIIAVDPLSVLELAETTGLTAYDASYLWVARSIGAELVTLDRKLAAAVR
ncbi:type II toxin-antitoxin system VapC family toxin [Rhodopila sp.]|uniref:type II toxin-antitoxin system VapC family toxin n=1 Tax=Rhodopila sp. TaxID=2480087 RepID=UPI002D80DC23|nr:type II toxin-antitoxin system VapC family toxin [Rhodopila sp.]